MYTISNSLVCLCTLVYRLTVYSHTGSLSYQPVASLHSHVVDYQVCMSLSVLPVCTVTSSIIRCVCLSVCSQSAPSRRLSSGVYVCLCVASLHSHVVYHQVCMSLCVLPVCTVTSSSIRCMSVCVLPVCTVTSSTIRCVCLSACSQSAPSRRLSSGVYVSLCVASLHSHVV